MDYDSKIILANKVTQDCTDHPQLIPQIEQIEETCGQLSPGTKFSADNGYHSGPNLCYLEQRGFDGYIPNKIQATEMKTCKKPDKKFSKDKFAYDPYKDEFTCPNNDKLVLKGVYNYNGKIQHKYYGANCSKCPDRPECTKNRVKIITSDEYEAERQRMAHKMQTNEAREEYAKQKKTLNSHLAI